MPSVRIGDGPAVPAMLDPCDEIVFVQVVTCDPGAGLMASAREGGMIWLLAGDDRDREAVIVGVDRDAWEITCALPSGTCPFCGTPVNEAQQHLNALIGSACAVARPRVQEGEDGE